MNQIVILLGMLPVRILHNYIFSEYYPATILKFQFCVNVILLRYHCPALWAHLSFHYFCDTCCKMIFMRIKLQFRSDVLIPGSILYCSSSDPYTLYYDLYLLRNSLNVLYFLVLDNCLQTLCTRETISFSVDVLQMYIIKYNSFINCL